MFPSRKVANISRVLGPFLEVYFNIDILGATTKDGKNYEPIGSSSHHFTFEKQDKIIISRLRNWIRAYCKETNSLLYDKCVPLSERSKYKEDFDVLVQVTDKKIIEKEQKVVFKIQDDSNENSICELHTENTFRFIERGDVIRIRSVLIGYYLVYFSNKPNIIILNPFSNILRFSPFMNLFTLVKSKINQTDVEITWNELMTKEPSSLTQNEDEVLKLFERNIIISPKKTHNESTVTFTDFKSSSGKLGRFRMDLQVFDVLPDGGDFLKLYCKSCQSTYIFNNK